MKTKILVISILISALCISASAQKTFKLKNYVLSNVGDEWQYKNLAPDGLSPIVVGVSEKRDFKSVSTFKRDENNGDYRLQTLDKKGLTVYWLYFKGGRVIEYEKPVRLMPAKLKVGEIYKSSSPYKYLVKDEVKETGLQTYEVEIIGTEDIKIGEKTFKDTLVFTTKALRTDSGGTQKGYELREWHVKRVGAIKVTGTLYWNDEKGNRTRTFKINAELEKAKVKGKEIKIQ